MTDQAPCSVWCGSTSIHPAHDSCYGVAAAQDPYVSQFGTDAPAGYADDELSPEQVLARNRAIWQQREADAAAVRDVLASPHKRVTATVPLRDGDPNQLAAGVTRQIWADIADDAAETIYEADGGDTMHAGWTDDPKADALYCARLIEQADLGNLTFDERDAIVRAAALLHQLGRA